MLWIKLVYISNRYADPHYFSLCNFSGKTLITFRMYSIIGVKVGRLGG